MEVKKSAKANLEKMRLLYTEIGFVLALLVVWGAFEYQSKGEKTDVFDDTTVELIEEEIIPITQDTPQPPPETPNIPVL